MQLEAPFSMYELNVFSVRHILMVYQHSNFFMLWCLDRALHMSVYMGFIEQVTSVTMFSECSHGEISKVMSKKGGL